MKLPRKIGRWIVITVVLVVLYFTLTGSEGLINLYRTHSKVHSMVNQIHELNVTIDSLKVIIKKLEHDTVYIEKIAREKLGMARKNEKIYKFIDK